MSQQTPPDGVIDPGDPPAEPLSRDPIPLAEEREKAMKEAAERLFKDARDLVDNGMMQAAGYRVLIQPLEGTQGLEAAEAEQHPVLAERGFEAKSIAQKAREDRGEQHGIVLHIGPIAYARHGGPEYWCAEGDVVVFNRYAGIRVEHPPGSQHFYQLMNDEDVYGRIV